MAAMRAMHILLAALPALFASSVHVGVCQEKEASLYPRGAAARIELLVEVENGVAREVDVGRVGAPSRVVASLSREKWFALDAEGRSTIAGPFAEARVVYSWNETDDGDTEPPGIGDDSAKLVLGACDRPGTLYATQELSLPQTHAVSARASLRARELSHDAGPVKRFDEASSGNASWSHATVTTSLSEDVIASYPPEMLADSPRSWDLRVFTLRHPMLDAPVRIGGVDGDTSVDVTLARVVALPGGNLLVVVVTNASQIESGDEVEADVFVLREDGVSRVPIALQGWGC